MERELWLGSSLGSWRCHVAAEDWNDVDFNSELGKIGVLQLSDVGVLRLAIRIYLML